MKMALLISSWKHNNHQTIPYAQHSLLKEKHFKDAVPGFGFLIKIELLGDDAFAEGYLEFVADWIEEKTEEN